MNPGTTFLRNWAEAWIAPQDLNPDWPRHVRATLQDLARRLGHGV
jgi:hypothetical protein